MARNETYKICIRKPRARKAIKCWETSAISRTTNWFKKVESVALAVARKEKSGLIVEIDDRQKKHKFKISKTGTGINTTVRVKKMR